MNNFLFVMDIGNTNTVLGIYKGDELANHWRIGSRKHMTADEYALIIKELFSFNNIAIKDIQDIIISCVVPPLVPILKEMSKKYFSIEPMFVGSETDTGITVMYKNPKEVGADRIVNAVAAFNRYKSAVIIVDFGTAITFDVISEKGEYLGGAIYPGISISINALYDKTARLPRIELSSPGYVIGRTTEDSIRAGVIYGTVAMVDGMIKKIKDELGCGECKVTATGGMAKVVAAESKTIEEVNPFLTLEGLKILFDRLLRN